ncbi:MAG: hypothetical protein LBK60_10805 [Verrucomicrobiales bacterium]|nr:hypothetical protein [Verrucomicrobiales bacterium]
MKLIKRGGCGVYYVRFRWRGVDVWRSTGFSERETAKAAAKAIVNAVKMERIDALTKTKLKSPYPPLAKLVELYRAHAAVRHRTKVNNINALRNVCFLVLKKELADLKADALTASLVRDYQAAKLRAAKTEKQRASAEVSANSTLRQARSLFAKKVMHLYDDLTLPELTGFKNSATLSETKIHGFVPFPFTKWFGFCRVVRKIKDSDAAAWRLFVMMSKLGMSNREAFFATEDWIEPRHGYRVMSVKIREDFAPKSKNRVRDIPMSEKTYALLRGRPVPNAMHIVPEGRFAAMRLNKLFRQYFPNRQKGIYELRKHAGSLVATRDGILAAAKFLGDRNETAEKYYVALLKPIKPL